jgi:hypothetical protein
MENTSPRPKSRQQVNWSNVQTTESEKPPAHGWGPVQTTKYEKPVSSWESIQTTPLGKGIATTRYESQSHTWGPIQTARYGKPVYWGTPEAERNMALQHQVFGEQEVQFGLRR